MIRRFSAAIIGLALTMPILAVAPVAASGSGFVVDFDEQADDAVVGIVTNHQLSRQFNVQVTVTWENGVTDIVESGPVFVSNLAPHNSSPFKLDPVADVTGLAINSVTASGSVTSTKPTGGLHVEPCVFTGDVCNGTITNDGAAAANNVEVYATRGASEASHTDAAESATIATIAAATTEPYAITFEAGSTGEAFNLIAKTNTGAFYTSWNNYFSDLGNGTLSFVDEIAWMADESITTGCGAAIFCPKSPVSRAQMAVFLTRALGLTDTTPVGFEDIGTLSQAFQDAINALANAEVTAGCSADPLLYCPNQSVTRGQMSKFIVVGYALGDATAADQFTDDDGHFSEPYNDRMAETGITSGCGATTYCPNSQVLREQMAVFMFRADAFLP